MMNNNENNGHKRTFQDIRKKILISLSKGQKTINQLSTEADINWKTVSNHLIYLLGTGLVKEILSTPYVRIFELSYPGKDYVNTFLRKSNELKDKKIPLKIMVK